MKENETVWENLSQFVEDSVSGAAIPGAYWFPLERLAVDIPVAAYDTSRIFSERPDLLDAVMRECGIQTVTQVDLDAGPAGVFQGRNIFELLHKQYEYEVFDLRFWRSRRRETAYDFPNAREAYYFDESRSWLLYVSHEDSLTFAGEEFAAAARRIIPDKYLCEIVDA